MCFDIGGGGGGIREYQGVSGVSRGIRGYQGYQGVSGGIRGYQGVSGVSGVSRGIGGIKGSYLNWGSQQPEATIKAPSTRKQYVREQGKKKKKRLIVNWIPCRIHARVFNNYVGYSCMIYAHVHNSMYTHAQDTRCGQTSQ